MPVEHSQETIGKTTNPDTVFILQDEIVSAWHQLAPENQAIMTLTFVNEVLKGAWGKWLTESIPHQTEDEIGESIFHIYSLSDGNLERAFSEEEISQLEDNDIKQIVDEMRIGFLFDSGFWYAVKMIGQRILEERTSSRQMGIVDEAV